MNEKYQLGDWSWQNLIDPDCISYIFEGNAYVKPTINSIIERLNRIEDNTEAIYTMFVIQQKIGAAKEQSRSYSHKVNVQMIYKLEVSLRILLKKRMEG